MSGMWLLYGRAAQAQMALSGKKKQNMICLFHHFYIFVASANTIDSPGDFLSLRFFFFFLKIETVFHIFLYIVFFVLNVIFYFLFFCNTTGGHWVK